ncbi:MAG: hypothetical protein WCL08_01250 [Verrucomicrobiota bacterium]
MSDPLSTLDLKFLPDWLKESPAPNRYAGYEGDPSARRQEGRDRFGQGQGGGRGQGGGARGGSGPRSGGSGPQGRRDGGPRSGRPDERSQGGARGPRAGGGSRGGSHNQDSGRGREEDRRPHSGSEVLPAQVRLQFLPEPVAAENIAKQIRQSGRAYPLFGTARMFLEKPERHVVRVTSSDAAHPLHQLEDGPVAFDATILERGSFRALWDRFYREEVVETEPPKGNYSSVARSRTTGQILGPTSYHGYQVALRKLYEERFSRRMSFLDFQREEIELISGEQAVADWKAQASRQIVYHTKDETNPIQFKTLEETEAHFRKACLATLRKTAVTLSCSGRSSRELPERGLVNAARDAFERELAYPAGMVHGLRSFFDAQGLQVFKHKKRVLYVSAIRPKRAVVGGFADGPATLLRLVEATPRITKRDLAVKFLGVADAEQLESPEFAARKNQLAADLYYLIHAGHVIEFADGRLDLPLSPQGPDNRGGTEDAGDSDEDGRAGEVSAAAVSSNEEGSVAEAIVEDVISAEPPIEVRAGEVSEAEILPSPEVVVLPAVPLDGVHETFEPHSEQDVVEPLPVEIPPQDVEGTSQGFVDPVSTELPEGSH